MRKIFVGFLLIGLIGMSACHKNTSTPSTTLKFSLMFGSNNIALEQNYEAPDGKYYNFQDYKFFLSHIKFILSNGDSVEVCPMAYVSADDPATWNLAVTNVPGNYTGIKFNIGLDSTQDAMSPNTSDTSSPIFVDHFMTWGNTALEYVFLQVDGDGDTSSTAINFPITYHVGTQPFYTQGPVLAKNFSISASGQNTLNITADLQKVFYSATGGNTINIVTSPVTQTTDNPALAHTFITYFAQIFTLN